MEKYICTVCDYVYDPELGDPENGIEPGTSFEDLPEDWVCPPDELACELAQEAGMELISLAELREKQAGQTTESAE